MDIVVRREGERYVADWGGGARPVAVGWGGVAEKIREGDGVTPVGRWPVRRVYYRADKFAPPETHLPVDAIASDSGWCDAPDDPNYNHPVRLPYPASAERMWRDDALYDVVAVLGFNDAPAVPGKGSAIFLHVANPGYPPTEGCVAMARDDLLDALKRLGADGAVLIEPA